MKQNIYMDYAATTPLDNEVLAAMRPFLEGRFYNPSAGYLAAHEVAKDLEMARADVARLLGARPTELVFTAGGTEANNLAIQGIMRAHPDANIITSSVEHDSVLEPAGLFEHKRASVSAEGVVDVTKLQALIDEQTVLISVMYVNNEVGSIQPIREIASLLAEIRVERRRSGNQLPLLFHTDACQAGQYLDLHVSRLGVDMMTINAGKVYGPKQCGALYVKAGIDLRPLVLGGGQERGLRSGTENVANIVGFAKALTKAQDMRREEAARVSGLQRLFIDELASQVPQAIVNGPKKNRLPNNVHVTIPGVDNERLMMELDERGIQCATGSACAASSEDPSHVLQAMGMSDADAQASLRFTMGRGTSEADVRTTVKSIAECLGVSA